MIADAIAGKKNTQTKPPKQTPHTSHNTLVEKNKQQHHKNSKHKRLLKP